MAVLPRIAAYGGGGFRVGSMAIGGSVLVLPDGPRPWAVASVRDIQLNDLQPVISVAAMIELLVVGSGRSLVPLSAMLHEALAAHGIRLDTMDTGAACRTYNVLAAEGRRVAAALIAV